MNVLKDKRFSGVVKDPRFKKIPRKHVKTDVDKRFHGMFNEKQFELKYLLDKRGSPLDHKVSEDFQKFYRLNEKEKDVKAENSTSDEEGVDVCKKGNHNEESDGGTEDVETNSASKATPSDDDGSTSTDTEFSEDEQEADIDHQWHDLDADAPRGSNITRRLALCNMDWDRLRAEDFLVVFNSFKPPDGVINSIKIYPSEFGLERMKKEKLQGPAELIEEKLDGDEDNSSSKSKHSHFHQEKLRQYQINRLKYFFAVVDCDCPKTADTLYDQLNGIQFESSGCTLDLRFIPDDMTFEQEPVSVANSLVSPSDYKPTLFVTSALNQVKVDLTWDETDPRRKEVLEKAFTDPESLEKDLKEYLASPSESEDETEELEDTTNSCKLSSKEAIAKYRALLQTLEDKEKGKQDEEEFDMEITWDSGLKEKTEKLVKEKALNENLTPFEEKLQKKKDLKKQKKDKKLNPINEDDDTNFSEESELELSEDDEQEELIVSKGKGHKKNKCKSQKTSEADEKKTAELALLLAEPEKYSSDSDYPTDEQKRKKKMKKKNKQKEKKEDLFMEHIDDPRFAAVYTSHLFHIDPSNPKYKERKKLRSSMETKSEKHDDFSPLVQSDEISKKGVDCIGGLKTETQKSFKIEALKKKLTPFCNKFQKKKGLQKSEEYKGGRMQKDRDSAFVADISTDTSIDVDHSGKRKKGLKKQNFAREGNSTFVAQYSFDDSYIKRKKNLKKLKKQTYPMVDSDIRKSSINAELLHGSPTSAYFGEENDSGILIFSSGSTDKQASKCLSETFHHVNSVRKKSKKFHVS